MKRKKQTENDNKAPDLGDLLTQVRITNRLLAAQLKTTVQQNELVVLLASTGASHKEVADVLNTSPNVVGQTLLRMRKKKRSK